MTLQRYCRHEIIEGKKRAKILFRAVATPHDLTSYQTKRKQEGLINMAMPSSVALRGNCTVWPRDG